ncbi:hypothetical protein BN000_05094 [Mycobacterium europaeum]|uniref:Uncharacterized protein n=1 Tax=Mycobacterium europaeum TaxID=761804 RepID=A0A0U1DS10_9MYCO|nr:hypothetical protein BN000_05094 [Mycobacterium europaeum]
MGGQHDTEAHPQYQQTQVLGSAPADLVQPVVVFVRIDLDGLGGRVPG